MTEFAKGVRVKVQETKYGEILKLGINLEQFSENPINDRGYINIDLKKSKNDNWYAELNKYSKGSENEEEDGESIPF